VPQKIEKSWEQSYAKVARIATRKAGENRGSPFLSRGELGESGKAISTTAPVRVEDIADWLKSLNFYNSWQDARKRAYEGANIRGTTKTYNGVFKRANKKALEWEMLPEGEKRWDCYSAASLNAKGGGWSAPSLTESGPPGHENGWESAQEFCGGSRPGLVTGRTKRELQFLQRQGGPRESIPD